MGACRHRTHSHRRRVRGPSVAAGGAEPRQRREPWSATSTVTGALPRRDLPAGVAARASASNSWSNFDRDHRPLPRSDAADAGCARARTPSGSRRATPQTAVRCWRVGTRDTGGGRRRSCPRGGRSAAASRARRCRRRALRARGCRWGAAGTGRRRGGTPARRALGDPGWATARHAVRLSLLRFIMPSSMAPRSLAAVAVMAVEDSGVSSGTTDRGSRTRVNRSGRPRYPTSTLNRRR